MYWSSHYSKGRECCNCAVVHAAFVSLQVSSCEGRGRGAQCGPSNVTEYYDALWWVNTSAVKSVNSFLKKFRVLGWYSGLHSLMVFLPILLSCFNVDLSRRGRRHQVVHSHAGEAVERGL
jgi:hypothetical protein